MAIAPLRILFVCMGNICRSPAGEGVLRSQIAATGLGDRVDIDSAGTIGFHAGNPPDRRMLAAASRRGYDLAGRARQVTTADLDRFDLILTMDEANRRDVLALARDDRQRARVRAFCEFCQAHAETEVPDPYYGGREGFDHVLDMLEDGCAGVVEWVRREVSAPSTLL